MRLDNTKTVIHAHTHTFTHTRVHTHTKHTHKNTHKTHTQTHKKHTKTYTKQLNKNTSYSLVLKNLILYSFFLLKCGVFVDEIITGFIQIVNFVALNFPEFPARKKNCVHQLSSLKID